MLLSRCLPANAPSKHNHTGSSLIQKQNLWNTQEIGMLYIETKTGFDYRNAIIKSKGQNVVKEQKKFAVLFLFSR